MIVIRQIKAKCQLRDCNHKINPLDKISFYGNDIYINGVIIGILVHRRFKYNIESAMRLKTIHKSLIKEVTGKWLTIELHLRNNFFINNIPALNIKNNAGIYGINLKKINSIYVGQSGNVKRRIQEHFENLSIGFHVNKHLQDYWIRNSPDDFSVGFIEKFPGRYCGTVKDREWLAERERYWIDFYRGERRCVNITDGEFINTNKTDAEKIILEEQEQLERQIRNKVNDDLIKLRKLEIRNKINDLENLISFEEERTRLLLEKKVALEKSLKECKSIFNFFQPKKKELIKSIQNQLKYLIEFYENECKKCETALIEVKNLRFELKNLRTSKQIDAANKRKRFRF